MIARIHCGTSVIFLRLLPPNARETSTRAERTTEAIARPAKVDHTSRSTTAAKSTNSCPNIAARWASDTDNNNIPAIRAEMDLPATDSRLIEAHTCDQSRDGFAGDTDSDCRCAFVSNCRNIFVDLCHRICVDKNLRLMPEESFCPQANEHCGGRTAVGRASDKHSERWG